MGWSRNWVICVCFFFYIYISLTTYVVSWCLRSSGSEAAAPSGYPGQDRGQRWTSVTAPAVCCQPTTLTAGDGDWTVTFPGEWTPRLPWSTLSSRYGAGGRLTSVDWKRKIIGWWFYYEIYENTRQMESFVGHLKPYILKQSKVVSKSIISSVILHSSIE